MFWTRNKTKHFNPQCNGNVSKCKYDNCNDCPVSIKTLGDQAQMFGEYEKAIVFYEQAIEMEPKFAEAWNNCAAAYGQSHNYEKSLFCAEQALAIDKNYSKAVFSKAVSLKNLKRKNEAKDALKTFKYLVSGSDKDPHVIELGKQIDQLNEIIIDQDMKKKVGSITSKLSLSDSLTRELTLLGISEGYLAGQIPFVPELSIMANSFVTKCFDGLIKDDPNVPTRVIISWCCYGGMGAAMHWHMNWDHLSKNDLFSILTQESGLNEMDEYICDYIGLPFGSKEEKVLTSHIKACSQIAVIKIEEFHKRNEDESIMLLIIDACKSMYLYGIGLQLNRLGMK